MERQPRTPQEGGEHQPVNSYGTDDPAIQADIERARTAASEQRRRSRAQLEELVEAGLSPDDAEAVIEYEQAHLPAQTPEIPVEGPELLPDQPPRIYVADVAAHEAGRVHGRWIDATDPLPELQEQIVALLMASPVPNADRYTIDAHTGFNTDKIQKDTPLAVIAKIAHGVYRYGPAYSAYLSVIDVNDEDALERFDDLHVGTFDSPEAWARAFGDDLQWEQHLDSVVGKGIRQFISIDYKKFAYEARQHWDIVEGPDGKTHVFIR